MFSLLFYFLDNFFFNLSDYANLDFIMFGEQSWCDSENILKTLAR